MAASAPCAPCRQSGPALVTIMILAAPPRRGHSSSLHFMSDNFSRPSTLPWPGCKEYPPSLTSRAGCRPGFWRVTSPIDYCRLCTAETQYQRIAAWRHAHSLSVSLPSAIDFLRNAAQTERPTDRQTERRRPGIVCGPILRLWASGAIRHVSLVRLPCRCCSVAVLAQVSAFPNIPPSTGFQCCTWRCGDRSGARMVTVRRQARVSHRVGSGWVRSKL